MKNKKLLGFIITILVVAFLCAGFYFILRLNVFPQLTNKFNQITAKVFLPDENPAVEDAVPLKKDKIILESGKISIENFKYKFVHVDNFDSVKLKDSILPSDNTESENIKLKLLDFVPSFKIDDVEFNLTENNSVLTLTGIVSRFLSYYNEDNPEVVTWTYTNDYPIITHPGVFQNIVVFIDGNLQLKVLDLITGKEIKSINCPVYPNGKALAVYESYFFEGLDNKLYAVSFSDYGLLKIKEFNRFSVENPFAMDEDVQSKILDNVANWLTTKKEIILPEVSIYPVGYNPLPVDIDNLEILVYSPDVQGVYTLGLCDENSAFITTYAFVAVFTSNGELRTVSMDYVADRPNVEIHLSDDEIYYIVMCKLDQNTDNQQIYFTVK